jgi:hypothetical protein
MCVAAKEDPLEKAGMAWSAGTPNQAVGTCQRGHSDYSIGLENMPTCFGGHRWEPILWPAAQ